jgi:tRNA (cytidine/uridine-2'-O-)-methyltransferase
MSRPRLHLALVEPSIPQNTGNVGRLALAFGMRLHLVGELGFSLEEKACRRAGLDYWKHVPVARWGDLATLERALPESRFWLFSARGRTPVTEVPFAPNDVLVFGNEARGLPPELIEKAGELSVRIPLASRRVRSLNLANAVSIGVYEAARRLGFPANEDESDEILVERVPESGEPGRPPKSARSHLSRGRTRARS